MKSLDIFCTFAPMKRNYCIFKYLISVHLLGLVVLTLIRFGMYLVNGSMLAPESHGDFLLQTTSFVHGLWFDNVIGCYILTLPLALTLFGFIFGYFGKWLLKPLTLWFQTLWSIVIFISIADIPYFSYFFKHLNSSIWNWAEYGTTTLGMIFGNLVYYPAMLAVIAVIVLFVWGVKKVHKTVQPAKLITGIKPRFVGAFITILLIGLCIFGIRGRLGYNPIKVSAAYYCEDAFLNQLGVSATFNLLSSTLDDFRPENKELKLINTKQAMKNVCEYYNWNVPESVEQPLPIIDSRLNIKNVVLIFMESMSAELMGAFGNEEGLTPFLDSLAQQSVLFTNCYSTGIHTNHGLFATLYSYPAIMERNMMKGTNIPHYNGLPNILQANGYRTMFYMTHESQYDNMNAFFRTNGFDEIYSQEDYPADKIANSFGVQDDYLFSYANWKILTPEVPADTLKPFFASLLTISNHPPYVIPQWFHPIHQDEEKAIVEYADKSILYFFREAQKHSWYSHTLFVLVGDHGKLVGKAENEMPQTYNHIPLIFFYPGIRPQHLDKWATQMDIQPTILALLGMKSKEKNFGINLFSQERPCTFYSADDIIGARTHDRLYVYKPSEKHEWFFKNNKRVNNTDSVFSSMETYLFSNLQAMQEIIKQHE